jgi:hypothetical protein
VKQPDVRAVVERELAKVPSPIASVVDRTGVGWPSAAAGRVSTAV